VLDVCCQRQLLLSGSPCLPVSSGQVAVWWPLARLELQCQAAVEAVLPGGAKC
jgi:hypothetical protein